MNDYQIDELNRISTPKANPNFADRFAMTLATIKLYWVLAISLLIANGCSVGEFSGSSSRPASSSGLSGQLILTGSSTVAPLIQEIANRFERIHPEVRVDVQTGGSSRGIRDAKKGAADIGMSSRNLKTDESNSLDSTVIAWDGVTFVTHQDNSINEVTPDQLRKIYLGKINNWSQVGGADERIVVSSRAAGRSELDLVCKFLEIEPGDIQADIIDGETQQSLKSVINNRKAITYTSVGAAQDAASRGEPLKLLPLNGVEASAETIQAGEFPLARPLLLTVRKRGLSANKADLVEAFLEFAADSDMADLATGLGFVPNQEASTANDAK